MTEFSDIEDFLHRCDQPGFFEDTTGDAALAALCTQAANGGRHDAADDDATCLLLWVLLAPLIGRSQNSDIATPLDADDAQAEIAAGLWEEAVRVVPESTGVASRLINAGRRRARRAARAEFDYQLCKQRLRELLFVGTDPGGGSAPEQVVALAIVRGVINELEGDLIVSTRLEEERLKAVAARRGLTPRAASHRRHRAETRLLAWMRGSVVPSRHSAGAHAAFLTSFGSQGVSGLRPKKQPSSMSLNQKEVMPRPSDGPANRPGRGPDAIKPSDASDAAHGDL